MLPCFICKIDIDPTLKGKTQFDKAQKIVCQTNIKEIVPNHKSYCWGLTPSKFSGLFHNHTFVEEL